MTPRTWVQALGWDRYSHKAKCILLFSHMRKTTGKCKATLSHLLNKLRLIVVFHLWTISTSALNYIVNVIFQFAILFQICVLYQETSLILCAFYTCWNYHLYITKEFAKRTGIGFCLYKKHIIFQFISCKRIHVSLRYMFFF